MAFSCTTQSNQSELVYPFNWLNFLDDMLPIIRREERIEEFYGVPMRGLWNKYIQFLEDRCVALLETKVNGQTIVLEKYLNMLFDPQEEEIKIISIASNFQTEYVYRRGEDPAQGDTDVYLPRRGEQLSGITNPTITGVTNPYLFRKEEVELNVDFKVQIPLRIYDNINIEEVRAIVNIYKFVGTFFSIEAYQT